MIGILNVNPYVDKTVFVDKISPGGIIIPEKTNVHSGGKGVNVVRVLKNFLVKFRFCAFQTQ